MRKHPRLWEHKPDMNTSVIFVAYIAIAVELPEKPERYARLSVLIILVEGAQ